MPWNNQTGGPKGGGGRGPWGQGPAGGGGPTPPDLEELLRKGQDRLRQAFPSGQIGRGGIIIAGVLLAVVWLGSGIYFVQEGERGVVQTFGAYTRTTPPGIGLHVPWPVESVQIVRVSQQRQTDVGFQIVRAQGGQGEQRRDSLEESLMLTGNENIVDIDFTVLWAINDPVKFLFNLEDQSGTVKDVAESAMREVIGQMDYARINPERAQVQARVQELMQGTLDSYDSGILVSNVQLQPVNPPAAVVDAFRDVQAARAEAERAQNEAAAYRNTVLPAANGNATRIVQGAQAYREQVIAEAQGEAERFLSVWAEYRNAPDVTRRRIYLETLERVMRNMNKIVVDSANGGVVPYLPLSELQRRPGGQTQGQQPQAGGQP